MLEAILPAVVIFLLRCVDVSLGTLRLILTVQGRRTIAAAIGFVEVSVFITAVATVVSRPLDVWRVIGYGGGFATGTFIGMTIDRRLALGNVMVRAITRSFEPILTALTQSGFGVTVVEGRGGRGSEVGVLFSVTRRRRLTELLGVIHSVDAGAIVTVQEVRTQRLGYFSPKRPALTAQGPLEDSRIP
jgi:uncharacterized protein YebE (UPF0316 family)